MVMNRGQCTRWPVLFFQTGTSLRRLRLGIAGQASGTSLSDVSATPDAETSRITCCRGSRVSFTAFVSEQQCRVEMAQSLRFHRAGPFRLRLHDIEYTCSQGRFRHVFAHPSADVQPLVVE